MDELRRCYRCGEDKPLTAKYWPRGARGTIGLGYQCKACKSAATKEKRDAALAADPEAFRATAAARQQERRMALKEAALVEQLAIFADEYDRLRADGMTNEHALWEAIKVVPNLRVKGA